MEPCFYGIYSDYHPFDIPDPDRGPARFAAVAKNRLSGFTILFDCLSCDFFHFFEYGSGIGVIFGLLRLVSFQTMIDVFRSIHIVIPLRSR